MWRYNRSSTRSSLLLPVQVRAGVWKQRVLHLVRCDSGERLENGAGDNWRKWIWAQLWWCGRLSCIRRTISMGWTFKGFSVSLVKLFLLLYFHNSTFVHVINFVNWSFSGTQESFFLRTGSVSSYFSRIFLSGCCVDSTEAVGFENLWRSTWSYDNSNPVSCQPRQVLLLRQAYRVGINLLELDNMFSHGISQFL